jgi:hypothetical protein
MAFALGLVAIVLGPGTYEGDARLGFGLGPASLGMTVAGLVGGVVCLVLALLASSVWPRSGPRQCGPITAAPTVLRELRRCAIAQRCASDPW